MGCKIIVAYIGKQKLSNMLKKSLFLIPLGVVILSGCSEDKEQSMPEVKSITEAVYASGDIRPKEQYYVYSTVSGILKKRYVEEGDTVLPGTTLFQIESSKSDLQASTSRLGLQLAEANASQNSPILSELESAVSSAKFKYHNDSSHLSRYKILLDQKVIPQVDYDNMELQLETSRNNYLAAVQRLKLRKRQLANEVQTARNQYKISTSQSEDFSIRSFMDGKVYAVYKENGEIVHPQERLAMIGSQNQFIAQLVIDELDMNRVSLGQKVVLTFDMYGEEVFEGTISKIYPVLDSKTQTFKVEAILTNSPEVLYPGLTAEANLIVSTKDSALVIPRSFLRPGDSVCIGEDKFVKVVPGLKNLEYVEILEGLTKETPIFK